MEDREHVNIADITCEDCGLDGTVTYRRGCRFAIVCPGCGGTYIHFKPEIIVCTSGGAFYSQSRLEYRLTGHTYPKIGAFYHGQDVLVVNPWITTPEECIKNLSLSVDP